MATEPGVWRLRSPQWRRERHAGAEVGHFLRSVDYLLLLAVAGLAAYGLWVVRSVTRADVVGNPDYYFVRQAIYVGMGAVVLGVATAISPQVYRRLRAPLYGLVIALVLLVAVAGASARGSKRWIDLDFFRFQPSELGKLLLILILAGFLVERARRGESTRTALAAVGLAALPIALVFRQPDVGTSLVYCAILAATLYFAGTRWTHLVGLGLVAAGAATAVLWALPANGVQILAPYQVDRLVGFFHPDVDPSGTTYNINQSITAVGSGGLDGRGVSEASQTDLDYLPEHATDFVFSSLAEQRGFLGASILLLLYALVVWRGIKIVAIAPDLFSTIVSGAIVSALLSQVFVNIGMTIGVAPITGIPLPFVSYGGSSMVTSFAMIGLLEAIHVRGRLAAELS